MDRRDFLKSVGLGAASLTLGSCVSASNLFQAKEKAQYPLDSLRGHQPRPELLRHGRSSNSQS